MGWTPGRACQSQPLPRTRGQGMRGWTPRQASPRPVRRTGLEGHGRSGPLRLCPGLVAERIPGSIELGICGTVKKGASRETDHFRNPVCRPFASPGARRRAHCRDRGQRHRRQLTAAVLSFEREGQPLQSYHDKALGGTFDGREFSVNAEDLGGEIQERHRLLRSRFRLRAILIILSEKLRKTHLPTESSW
jgi:hypothetical protein